MATKNKDIILTLEEFFAKAPVLPTNARETLVSIAPWIALIFGILGIIAGLSEIGISPLSFVVLHTGFNIILFGIVAVASSVLLLMAYPGLTKRQYIGWKYCFWSEVLSLISSILLGSLVNGLIGALIGFYILFQIKSYYK